MGTAAFAVPSLERILSRHQVIAVVTAPDKPAGRGKKLRISPVKEVAQAHDLLVLQPSNLKDPGFIEKLHNLAPDVQIVVAFRMLPAMVWQIPPLGTLNLHASLLPQYRGAAPINHAIFNGETTTGVSTFLIDEKIDTGQILKQAKTHIGPDETAGELHDRLMHIGADLLLETIDELQSDRVHPVHQDRLLPSDEQLHPAPKIFKEDCRINWAHGSEKVYNLIRGLSPVPGAFATILLKDDSKRNLKVFRAKPEIEAHQFEPGTILSDKNFIKVACKDGFLFLLEVQLEGKRKMEINDFLKGFSSENAKKML